MSEEVADIQLQCGCSAVYCTKRKVSERASVGLFVREREFSDHNTGNERGVGGELTKKRRRRENDDGGAT